MLFTDESLEAVPIHLLYEDGIEAWLETQPPTVRRWAAPNGFQGERNKVLLVPNAEGQLVAVLFGMGRRGRDELSCWTTAALSDRLPGGRYFIASGIPVEKSTQAAFGWLYGRYRFERYRKSAAPARTPELRLPAGASLGESERLYDATSLARDLINTPANDMTPEALAEAAASVARRFGGSYRQIIGDALLAERLPAVHAVGRASSVAPRLIDIQWGDPSHPKVTLVGKGVCFDSGGLDIKSASSMLLMKKDMSGAAVALALAQAVMDAQWPIRLRLIIPAVENAIAGNAFRPGDVLATRKGLSVEVGNTDAEGRLVLCDALTLADEDEPELLIDFATLTGAARVALGPELPALFSSDQEVAHALAAAGREQADPMWELPLWVGYDDELSSKVADLSNVSSSGFAGAITGGLFLRRFVTDARAWVHLDLYGWNGKERPGRPVGAEPQCVRSVFAYLKARYGA